MNDQTRFEGDPDATPLPPQEEDASPTHEADEHHHRSEMPAEGPDYEEQPARESADDEESDDDRM